MLSTESKKSEASGNPYLIFRARKEEFGLPAGRVSEIRTIPPALAEDLTKTAGLFCGSMSLHGQSIPVVDLGRHLGLGPIRPRKRHCLIVFVLDCGKSGPQKVGVLVDAVSRVVPIPRERISHNANGSPEVRGGAGRVRINGRVKQLLDPDCLVSIEEFIAALDGASEQQAPAVSLARQVGVHCTVKE
ncbi:MAG: chemotaxis protein CheW [Bryobacteraceae bacterium]